MEEYSIFHERYKLEKLLGKGAYSEVWLAHDEKTDIEVALKIFAPSTGLDDVGLQMFAHEFSLVVNVSDANILKPLFYDSYERKPYLVLPYCRQGSIKRKIGETTEDEAWTIMLDVARGLKSLHSQEPPIIHQDIKPDNILIADDGHYKITDFGVSTKVHSTLRKSIGLELTSAGTSAYMAPERFSRQNTPIMPNDIWSLGSMVYELLTGEVPFAGNGVVEGGLLQKSGAEIPELPGKLSSELRKTIESCLALLPYNRPTAEQLEEICSKRKAPVNNNKNKLYFLYVLVAILGIACGAILRIII